MKKFLAMFSGLVLIFTLVACSSSSGGGGKNDKPKSDIEVVSDIEATVRVSLAGWQLEDGIDPITGIDNVGFDTFVKEEFNPRFPNIKLEVYQVPWENAQAKQTAMLQSGDVDVIYSGGAFASQWMQQGLLRSIDDLIGNDSSFKGDIYLKGIWENSYSTVAFDGNTRFGLPAILGKRVTIYDKKMFEEWGVEPLSENPTPEEILDKAKQMTGKNPVTGEENYGLWWSGNSLNASTVVALTHAFGAVGAVGSLGDLKNIEWKLNEPEMVKVLEWIKEAAKYPPVEFVNGQGQENFGIETNNIAIALDHSGGATMGEYRANKDKDLLDRFVPVLNLGPKGEGWIAMDPFVMAKNAKNVEASWEVMKFLSGYETQKWNYENFQATPTLAEADFVLPEDKFIQKAMEVAAVSPSVMMDEANPFFSSEITPAINGFISQAANDQAPDIQKFLDDLQKRAVDWSARQ
ncbi:extracellular solute-binding protein [Bacillus sp. FJAT-49732]|uniref:Extracellular solute-binding protein n=1 Tax=Lederbergia citrisecunda TaxID=2833583 RepID=A0A942YJL1_9BACI|nr:extracellular solute-binding protein [Lederbergia citrisecunda]MBS4198229.1 extracellular solute-binding protein [Lederbergia citrisecunda]